MNTENKQNNAGINPKHKLIQIAKGVLYSKATVVIVLATIIVAYFLLKEIIEYSEFVRLSSQRGQLVFITHSLHNYVDSNRSFPPLEQTNGLHNYSWREAIYSADRSSDKGPRPKVVNFVAFIRDGCVWTNKEKDADVEYYRTKYGNPVIMLISPNFEVNWNESNELLYSKGQLSMSKTGEIVSPQKLRGSYLVRLGGEVKFIDEDYSEPEILQMLLAKYGSW